MIGAEVSSIEQRQILSGIISRAQQQHIQIVVLSNLNNPDVPEQADDTENRIYELIGSDKYDALILLSESFVNPLLRERIRMQLVNQSRLPTLLVGSSLPEFESELFQCINTSDENDIAEITDYLIEICGFKRIALLTGPLSLQVSNTRLTGYRKALEAHGIQYDESLVTEGDFWYNSGEMLAKEYLNGNRPEPEALICCNDYMAFGLLDAFFDAEEDITQHFAVIGYEFIPERNLHTPLLTTYRRNRQELGEAAVDILLRQLRGEPAKPFAPPSGNIISGQTCLSPSKNIHQREEMLSARMQKQYADWTLRSEMASKLTDCRSIQQFVSIMGDFLFVVRDAIDVVLCLFEDWYRLTDSSARTLLCRNTNHWADPKTYSVSLAELPGIVSRYPEAAVGYLTPLCFKEHLFGYCMVWYKKADTYDESYLQWLKTVSNCLEFLRLKGDVRYFLQCSTLSTSYDSVTGVFSADGLRDAFQLMVNAQHPQQITAIALRFRFGQDALNTTVSAKKTVSSLMAAVGVMKRFHGKGGLIGRISEFEFLMLFPAQTDDAVLLSDAVYTEIVSDAGFIQFSNTPSCLLLAQTGSFESVDYSLLVQNMTELLDQLQIQTDQTVRLPHYQLLKKQRDALLQNPLQEERLQDAAETLHLTADHFNRIYKQAFGISYHQDHIQARMRLAKHLLIASDETITQIAECCGYTDSKYFIRQFHAETGLSPKQYRQLIREYLS